MDLLSALGRIKALCDQNDVRLFLVAVPSIEQVRDPSFFQQDYDLQLPQKHFEQFALAASIPYLDLLPILTTEAKERGQTVYLQGDGHLNNNGHQVSGQHIAEFVRQHTKQ